MNQLIQACSQQVCITIPIAEDDDMTDDEEEVFGLQLSIPPGTDNIIVGDMSFANITITDGEQLRQS